MKSIWNWLQGKKTTIATISGAILIYALNNGVVGPNEAQLISGILFALGLTANIGNAVATKNERQEGIDDFRTIR